MWVWFDDERERVRQRYDECAPIANDNTYMLVRVNLGHYWNKPNVVMGECSLA